MKPLTRSVASAALLLCAHARAVDVEGVLPASMDQPRIYVAISREPAGRPLAAKGDAAADLIGELIDGKKRDKNAEPTETFAVDAFLDTGASGIMLSQTTADALGIKAAQYKGKPITFYDVGVAGREAFAVTEPFYLRQTAYSGLTEGDDINSYVLATQQPVRMKIHAGGGLLDELTGGVDVVGMPVMHDRVMVVDCRPLAKMDKLRTSLAVPGDKSIPKPDVVVPLTYIDFDRFTQLEPAGAPMITTGANPLIGPSPFNKSDPSQPIVVTHKGQSAKLTMLLDTGAAASMISAAKARALGIVVDDDGKLTNVPEKEQFMLPIGGIGGTKEVHGFFADVLVLPASNGEPVRYVKAPLLVTDISVTDEKTKETYTLDGVFGMNYLVASASVSVGLNAGVDDIHDGAFDFFTVDNVKKTLGLQLKH